MSFPRKYKHLIELERANVQVPDYIWIVYAVCAVESNACGWQGWILDAAFLKTIDRYPTGTGDMLLPIDDTERCPRCGLPLFRTDVDVKFVPDTDQTPVHGIPGIDYEVAPTEYED